MKSQPDILVIGVGNEYRRDDGLGLMIARALQGTLSDVRVIEETGEGSALMEAWQEADSVILIDAVHSGGSPGKIYRLDAREKRIPPNFFRYSTHAFGAAEAIELARTLEELPPRLIIYGIEGKDFEAGEGLSSEVVSAGPELLQRVRDEVECLKKGAGCTSYH